MNISKPRIAGASEQVTYSVDVRSEAISKALWYRVDQSYGDLVSDSSDAALIALLIPAMATGEDIHLEGAVSERLWYHLPRLQKVLTLILPRLRAVQVNPAELRSDPPLRPSGVATGFSGGIDSFCVLADNFYSSRSASYKITHLLFNNVGSHGVGADALFQKRYQRLQPVADLLGLPLLMVNSNLDAFYGDALGFQQTNSLRNASVALLLQEGLRAWMYASGVSYTFTFVGATYDTSYSDAVTLPLISTGGLEAFSVGSEYTRIEKTLRVAEVPDSYGTLDVCVNAYHSGEYTNCSACWKCLRTLATLDIAGLLDRYRTSFDLEIYRSHRSRYLAGLSGSHDPLAREIARFAEQRGYEFPVTTRLYQAYHLATRPPAFLVRQVRGPLGRALRYAGLRR